MTTQTTDSKTTVAVESIVHEASKKTKVILGAFGNGRYSPAMAELYRDSQRLLGFTKEQAQVTATRIGVDAGQLGAGKVSIAYGKSISKDGSRTLKEIVKGMKIKNTWAMSIGSICSMLTDTIEQGLVIESVTITPELLAFVNDAVARIEVVDKLAGE